MNTKRPTPETDAEVEKRGSRTVETAMADFARRLERERDEAREKLDAVSRRAERIRCELVQAEAVHAEASRVTNAALYERAIKEREAMRSAIKEAHDEMHELMMASWANLPGRANDMIESIMSKLQPFLP